MSEGKFSHPARVFAHPVNVTRLPRRGSRETFTADAQVRAAIAAAYDLTDVSSFAAMAEINHWKAKGFRITGQVDAMVVQPCAVSGEPISVPVQEVVNATYVPSGSPLAKPRLDEAGELVFDVEGDDIPDEFDGSILDLADVWLEHFALGLDPFARAEGAEFTEDNAEPSDETASPFAALAALKRD